MAKLLVQESDGAREFELVDLEINVGRELDNSLRLPDPSVSRHHAVIRKGAAGFTIEDLQSSNGVVVNGVRVPSAPLRDGDRITLGQMQLTFVDPAADQAGPLGTVRMDAETMARFRERTRDDAPAAELTADPAAPRPAPAAGGKPGPSFLHSFLPDLPDDAVPLRNPDGSLQRGDLGTRLQAAFIDLSPLLAVGFLAILLARGILVVIASLLLMFNLVLIVAYLVLMPLYWMRCGASPGKKIMQLRVVPEADPAGRLDLNGALLRLLGYLANGAIAWVIRDLLLRILSPPGPPGHPWAGIHAPGALGLASLAIGLVPYLLMVRSDRRALEDIFSRSIVIKVDR